MDYKVITDGVFDVLKDKNYKKEKFEKGEYFTDSKKAFMVDYNEEKQLIILKTALLNEGEGVEWKELSSWILDEKADDRDKQSIKNDFCDAVLEALGSKAGVGGVRKIEMPSKKKNADTIDIESFTARFLAICPDHKEVYKNNVVKYGEFLYDSFFKEYGTKELEKFIKEGNKRHISKYFEFLNNAYINGEKNVASTVVYSIICPVLLTNESCKKEIEIQLEKFPYLSNAIRNAKKVLDSSKQREKYGI